MTWTKASISCVIIFSIFLVIFSSVDGFGRQDGERVLLNSIETLTLHNGRMTTARRTHPVPQLSCIGGTAGCKEFVPQTVQCYNRGSDGQDVQWECKTDMDNDYRFGSIEVVCEGYDSPNDPYVLKGSCGMEYTLDLTKEGSQRRTNSGSSGNSYESPSYSGNYKRHDEGLKTPKWVTYLLLAGVAWFVYKIYRSCVAQRQFSTTSSDHPQGPGFRGFGSGNTGGGRSYPSAPPPPYPGDSSSFGDTCGPGTTGAGTGSGSATWRPGFWSGVAGATALNYLFGRRNTGYGGGGWFGGNTYGGAPYAAPSYGYGGGSSYSSFGGGSSSYGGGSSGSREASGFGGTRRR